jgi:VanZ family protein
VLERFRLPADIANHFAYGAVYAAAGALHSVLAGAVLCAVAAIGCEVYQRVTKSGESSVRDVLATMAGALPVLTPLVF